MNAAPTPHDPAAEANEKAAPHPDRLLVDMIGS